MARPNKLGNSFLALDLEGDEENALKSHLKKQRWGGKQYLRMLVRKDLNIPTKLNIK